MKKKSFKFIVSLILLLVLIPVNVLAKDKPDPGIKADSEYESGKGGDKGADVADNTWARITSKLGGIRITFVDINGDAIFNKSFDFVTGKGLNKLSDKERSTKSIYHNGYQYAKGKVQLRNRKAFKEETITIDTLPTIATLYDNYIKYMKEDYPKIKVTDYKSDLINKPGNIMDEYLYESEEKWFKSLTDSSLAPTTAVKQMRAFIKALAKTVTNNKTEQKNIINTLTDFLENKCNNEMFMEVDSMIFAVLSGTNYKVNYLLTLTEMGYYESPYSKLLMYAPKTLMYAKTVGGFKGFKIVNKDKVPQYSKYSELLKSTDIGVGVGLNWIKREGECSQCNCTISDKGVLQCKEPDKNGKISTIKYSDKNTKLTDNQLTKLNKKWADKSWYNALNKYAVFAFTDVADGGEGCCPVYAEKYNDLPYDYKVAYDAICDKKDIDATCDCEYKNGNLICNIPGIKEPVKIDSNNDLLKTPEFNKIKDVYKDLNNIAVYAFASKDDGGQDCCTLFEKKYKNEILKNESWANAYRKICLEESNETCDACKLVNNKLVCTETIKGVNKEVTYGSGNDEKNLPTNTLIKDTLTKYKDFDQFAIYSFAPVANGGRGCCSQFKDDYKNGNMNADWKKAYEELCPTVCEPVPEPKVNVNNCCSDGTISKVEEADISDIFCNENTLKVSNYSPKENADKYIDKDANLNDYCDLYCTEKMSIEIPGAIPGVNGRYFKLSTTSRGTTSPYIIGDRSCKVRIKRDDWEIDYKDALQAQVDNYNKAQENIAYEKMYSNAIKNKINDSTPTTATCSISIVNGDNYNYCKNCEYKDGKFTCKDENKVESLKNLIQKYKSDFKKSDFAAGSDKEAFDKICKGQDRQCNVKYDVYPFVGKIYMKANLDYKKYNEVKIVSDFTPSSVQENDKYSNFDYSMCTVTPPSNTFAINCNATPISKESSKENEQDIISKRDSYTNEVKKYNDQFKSAISKAQELEGKLDKCSNYFTDYEGKDGSKNYNLESDLKFVYQQAFVNDRGGKEFIDTEVNFKNMGCSITGPKFADTESDLTKDQYSSNYNKTEAITSFNKEVDLINTGLILNSNMLRNYLTSTSVSNMFTTDAKYHGECSWEEDDNKLYTLIPSGTVADSTFKTADYNFTIHNYEYSLHLSTMDGIYQTKWDISKLGHNGKFNEIFKNAGNTCGNETPAEDGLLTCKIHVEHETVSTGKCNGTNGTNNITPGKVTTSLSDCDVYGEGYNLFNFKTVDEKKLFPQGTESNGKEFAYNWVKTDIGKQVLEEIETRGNEDTTYAPKNLTYSFILNSNDMKEIKKYNEQQNKANGYSDFTLKCSCDQNSCTKCISPFLTNLAAGNVKYNNIDHKVTGWSNSILISDIRNKLSW